MSHYGAKVRSGIIASFQHSLLPPYTYKSGAVLLRLQTKYYYRGAKLQPDRDRASESPDRMKHIEISSS
ncbi:uncharacterized protein FTOL_10670 [Fusarium torulosum]|uniref:Uncharacterized protein n=1 Tax=Fusarium torulosum TaxID=33205 RepID=A0AAE8MH56_9HYPO|nr:uncharacterized protein FTOL_10670 [Fusarium torulosum]